MFQKIYECSKNISIDKDPDDNVYDKLKYTVLDKMYFRDQNDCKITKVIYEHILLKTC